MDIGKTRFLSEKQFPFLINNYEVICSQSVFARLRILPYPCISHTNTKPFPLIKLDVCNREILLYRVAKY